MKTSNQEINRCLAVLRSFDVSNTKSAEIGGEQDMPFEQAFSNLAHAYLKDKAPSLLDYEVGFQLVDRNQDNTKAFGVFGFKVGNQWLYAPVFFLNGKLKGHELLYVKSQDLFIPMKENWLTYILNRKPHVLGKAVPRNPSHLGILPPNLYQLSRSPYKYASADKDWAKDAIATIAYTVTTNPSKDDKYKDLPDLPTFLKKEGSVVIKTMLMSCKHMPKLASAIGKFYDFNDVIRKSIDHVKAAEKESNSVLSDITDSGLGKPGGPSDIKGYSERARKNKKSVVDERPKQELKIAVYDGDLDEPRKDEFRSLSDKEKSKLLQDGVLITDKRQSVSIAYDVQSELKLTNPTESGIYEVLIKPNKWEKCLIVFGPHHAGGRENFAVIVRLTEPKNWLNIHPSHIWVKSQMASESWQKWLKDQTDAKSLEKGTTYIIVGPHGQGTCPFTVEKSLGDETGTKTYDVYFHCHADYARADSLWQQNVYKTHNYGDEYSSYRDGSRIVLTGRNGSSMRTGKGDIFIPDGFLKLELKKPKNWEKDDGPGMCCSSPYDGVSSSENPPIQPGTMDDIQLLIFEKTSGVKIYHNGTEIDINGRSFAPLQSLIHLVKDHGLREKQARSMLKQAAKTKMARFRIKYADQYYDLQRSGPVSPPIPEPPGGFDPISSGQYPTQNMLEVTQPVQGMSAALTNRDVYRPMGPEPDYQALQTAQDAASTGQREVFDTSMLGSLVKATSDDGMVDRWLPDIMKGMDRIGRILAIFYWHQDEFAERYGDGEMPEIEDSLRNAFEAVGDILLTLRQKTVDPYPDEMNKIDLNALANM